MQKRSHVQNVYIFFLKFCLEFRQIPLKLEKIIINDMAKFDFLPDLHHVYSKVAFFASYEQLQSQIFKNWTFRPHLVPPKGSNRG